MNSWLTTHYPHPDPDTTPWHIYLQHEHRHAVAGIEVGDQVFFYEYAAQKPLKGGGRFQSGAQGIVRVGRVSGAIYARSADITYSDDTVKHWSWGVPVTAYDTDGFVGLEDLLQIIGYKPGGRLRGFNAGTGVKKLSNDQAHELMRVFKSSRRRKSLAIH